MEEREKWDRGKGIGGKEGGSKEMERGKDEREICEGGKEAGMEEGRKGEKAGEKDGMDGGREAGSNEKEGEKGDCARQ